MSTSTQTSRPTSTSTTAEATDAAELASPLDALLVEAALGPVRRFAPDGAAARFAPGLARHPVATSGRLVRLAGELGRIGTSSAQPCSGSAPAASWPASLPLTWPASVSSAAWRRSSSGAAG
ncbi:MAG TPA: hypothetical protein VLR26_12645 [Frankiaceae bacterium]|nr:hypothetical protein [Frankiaceae bacterium]